LTFDDFDLDPDLMDGLDTMGYKTPTPIQQRAIPIILDNKDLIACAQTGTGKTAAYVLPLLDKILHTEQGAVNTLILAPTRELAQQIDQQVEGLAYYLGISSIPVYGGGDGNIWEQQKRALKQGVDILIATPGRLIAHLASGAIKLDRVKHLVLDEADRMLDMGFFEDIVKIVGYLPKDRQTVMFSATMPPKIRSLAKTILREPEEVSIAISKPAEGILQQAYLVGDEHKVDLVKHILAHGSYSSIIIFASTKEHVKKLHKELKRGGMNVKAFHSDLEQPEREEILREFKSRQLPVIVGTDVLSRGIDVEGIDLVVNYDVPPDPEDYVHRIGRTARAESTGTAITFINGKDQRKFAQIENLTGQEVAKLANPEGIPAGPEYHPLVKKKRTGGGHKDRHWHGHKHKGDKKQN
jgi:superfamily II DNA/RNA helicase